MTSIIKLTSKERVIGYTLSVFLFYLGIVPFYLVPEPVEGYAFAMFQTP